jgi:hypothetical protein
MSTQKPYNKSDLSPTGVEEVFIYEKENSNRYTRRSYEKETKRDKTESNDGIRNVIDPILPNGKRVFENSANIERVLKLDSVASYSLQTQDLINRSFQFLKTSISSKSSQDIRAFFSILPQLLTIHAVLALYEMKAESVSEVYSNILQRVYISCNPSVCLYLSPKELMKQILSSVESELFVSTLSEEVIGNEEIVLLALKDKKSIHSSRFIETLLKNGLLKKISESLQSHIPSTASYNNEIDPSSLTTFATENIYAPLYVVLLSNRKTGGNMLGGMNIKIVGFVLLMLNGASGLLFGSKSSSRIKKTVEVREIDALKPLVDSVVELSKVKSFDDIIEIGLVDPTILSKKGDKYEYGTLAFDAAKNAMSITTRTTAAAYMLCSVGTFGAIVTASPVVVVGGAVFWGLIYGSVMSLPVGGYTYYRALQIEKQYLNIIEETKAADQIIRSSMAEDMITSELIQSKFTVSDIDMLKKILKNDDKSWLGFIATRLTAAKNIVPLSKKDVLSGMIDMQASRIPPTRQPRLTTTETIDRARQGMKYLSTTDVKTTVSMNPNSSQPVNATTIEFTQVQIDYFRWMLFLNKLYDILSKTAGSKYAQGILISIIAIIAIFGNSSAPSEKVAEKHESPKSNKLIEDELDTIFKEASAEKKAAEAKAFVDELFKSALMDQSQVLTDKKTRRREKKRRQREKKGTLKMKSSSSL